MSKGAVGKDGLPEYISRGYFANNNGDEVCLFHLFCLAAEFLLHFFPFFVICLFALSFLFLDIFSILILNCLDDSNNVSHLTPPYDILSYLTLSGVICAPFLSTSHNVLNSIIDCDVT